MKKIFIIIGVLLLTACSSYASGPGSVCSERDLLFCEDFENLSGDLAGSQVLRSSLSSRWWVTSDTDERYLFPDFPLGGRSRGQMILMGDGQYNSDDSSILYSAEIDLEEVETARLYFNLIYRTEDHWDGLVVFGIRGGNQGISEGKNWVVLNPDRAYPDTVLIQGKLFPGYSGFSAAWSQEKIDLEPLLGEKAILVFYFSSDGQLEGWGAALDDIYINADPELVLLDTRSTIFVTELNLDLPAANLIAPALPRANAAADTNCDGSQNMLLAGTQGYIKGVNDNNTRVLVLHPDGGGFCWASLENIWIEGELSDLSRISDLQPEDYYLPVCPASYTPNLDKAGCPQAIAGRIDEERIPPYWIQSALVENGLITDLLLVPKSPQDSTRDPVNPDLRISPGEVNTDFERTIPSGGSIWVEVGETQNYCLIIQDQPGMIHCPGLSLSAAGPINLNLCWLGQGPGQACPPGGGKHLESCLIIPEDTSCTPGCPPGYQYTPGIGLCTLNRNPDQQEDNPTFCPGGMSVFREAGCCAEPQLTNQQICPPGYYYGALQEFCLPLPDHETCPEDYAVDPLTGVCVLENPLSPPGCTSIEAEFPVYEVTVRKSTRCIKSPPNEGEIVSSLNPFAVVEVLGLGEDGETLVIRNPEYQVPCWASLDDFYTDKLDLDILPIIRSGQ